VYTFLPLGLRVLNKVENIIREEMEAVGGQEMLMPSLHPKKNWVQTGRWDDLDNLFKFKSFYSKNEYALGPTHEEIITPLMKQYIISHKDLPFSIFQIQTKFRDEKRAKAGLLRGREFIMKDLYSFHATEKDSQAYYKKVTEAYKRIFERVGLGDITYLTTASGGTFSDYSHEFQVLTASGEDTIFVAEAKKLAVNQDIVKEEKTWFSVPATKLKKEKAIEVGNIFKLKTKYAKAFGLQWRDSKGKAQDVIMNCYGIGLPRVVGAIVEVFHDKDGIIWPNTVAPYTAHLVALKGAEKEADKLYDELTKNGIEVLYDDREVSAGEKFADADLIGIPQRVVVSSKTLEKDSVELKMRNKSKETLVKIDSLHEIFKKTSK
ncbi:MAG TPA: prolyl-tRNA synthetase, partial [candidate division CPR3 bacterium]|nr:prolyl-tRNA synthetase [candidate division CPR3 bacterium]